MEDVYPSYRGDEYPVPLVVAIALVDQNQVVDDEVVSWQIGSAALGYKSLESDVCMSQGELKIPFNIAISIL